MGLVLGAGTSALVAVTAVALRIDFVATVAGIGVVVGGLLGAAFAPVALRTDQPVGQALRLTLYSIPLGAAVFGLSSPWPDMATDLGARATSAAIFASISILALPVLLPVVMPIALAAILGGRRLARTGTRAMAAVAVSMAVVSIVGAVVAPTIADSLSNEVVAPDGEVLRSEPHWLARLLADRRIEIGVVNRSSSLLWLDVVWPLPDGGQSGTGGAASACSATSTLYVVEQDWALRAEIDDASSPGAGGLEARDPPLASGQEHSEDAELILRVDADGAVTIEPGRLADEDLGALPGCTAER